VSIAMTAGFAPTVAATSLAPAIFGLLGVLLGGLVTIAGNLLVQWRRERAEARAERLDAEAGMRVLAVQLDDIERAARSVEEIGSWLRFADADGWLATWDEERKRLAAAFARERQAASFDVVARPFLVAKLFRAATERREGDDVGADDRGYLRGVRQDVGAASRALRAALAADRPSEP
jgi:hypothetical protein